jgi:chromosome segregation ATPase
LLNVTNLCLEAGLGRDSFYRSSNTFRQRFTEARTNRESQEPELVSLREKIRVLKRTTKDSDHDTAKRTRELEDTIRVYANHIQALTLRNHHLEEENQRLQEQLTRSDPSVRLLRPRRLCRR